MLDEDGGKLRIMCLYYKVEDRKREVFFFF